MLQINVLTKLSQLIAHGKKTTSRNLYHSVERSLFNECGMVNLEDNKKKTNEINIKLKYKQEF